MKQNLRIMMLICFLLSITVGATILDNLKLKPFMFTSEISGDITPLEPSKLGSTKSWTYPIQTYEIEMKRTRQQLLPDGFPSTQMFTYGGKVNGRFKHSFPGPAILSFMDTPIYIIWTNNIIGKHFLPLDFSPPFDMTAQFFDQVPAVPHIHGLQTQMGSDGQPMAFWTSSGRRGDNYFSLKSKSLQTNQAIYRYYNTKQGIFFFHDHAMGITRLNVYAGLVGLYQIIDSSISKQQQNLIKIFGDVQRKYFAITDKSFNTDGSLYYPNKSTSSDFTTWVPQFFGNTILVNGKVWPGVNVAGQKYRFVFVNGCQSRYIKISFINNGNKLNFQLIRRDSDYLRKPVTMNQILLIIGGRIQIFIDLSKIVGQVLVKNNAVSPYPMGTPPNQFTSQVMKLFINPKRRFLQEQYKTSTGQKTKLDLTYYSDLTGSTARASASASASASIKSSSPSPQYTYSSNFDQSSSLTALINAKMNMLLAANAQKMDFIDQSQSSNFNLPSSLPVNRNPTQSPLNNKVVTLQDMKSSRATALDTVDFTSQKSSLRPYPQQTIVKQDIYPKFSQGTPYFAILVDVLNSKGQLSGVMIDGVPLKMGCEGSVFKQGQVYDIYLINWTMDDHPIHTHIINYQVVGRFKFDLPKYIKDWQAKNGKIPVGGLNFIPKQIDVRPYRLGPIQPPYEQQKLFMDVIRVPTAYVTVARIKISNHYGLSFPFDVSGARYVWHCHILEHQDNQMMRYFCIE